MTPLQINIMLHYHARVGDYRDGDFSPPDVGAAIDDFVHTRMLAKNKTGVHHITPKGEVYVRALMRVPEPTEMWVIPTFNPNEQRDVTKS